MKKIVLLPLAVILTVAFFSCKDEGPKSVVGTIAEASMNTVAVVDRVSGDTLYFTTIDADKSQAEGMYENDEVEVFYTGELNKTGQGEITSATKVVYVVSTLVGSWVQPIPGMDGVQGVKINENGVAESINMATLLYKSWARNADTLTLVGESIGNGLSFEFNEKWLVSKLTSDSLVLTSVDNLDIKQRYGR